MATIDTSATAMAKRGGVTPATFHKRDWATMTTDERIKAAEDWKVKLDAEIRDRVLLRDSLVVGIVALQQKREVSNE